MSNVVLEAFAAGAPVVATAVGGTPELVEDRVSGLLAPPGNPEALAARIREALTSDDLLRDLRMNARQRVLERFTFTAQADRYRELFAELVPTARHDTAPPRDGAMATPPAHAAAPESGAADRPCSETLVPCESATPS
jgi:hypothetical protein